MATARRGSAGRPVKPSLLPRHLQPIVEQIAGPDSQVSIKDRSKQHLETLTFAELHARVRQRIASGESTDRAFRELLSIQREPLQASEERLQRVLRLLSDNASGVNVDE